MHKNSIIVILVMFLSVAPAQAWDIMNGTEEGENYGVIWGEGYTYSEYVYPENPAWYDTLAACFFKIQAYLLEPLNLVVGFNITKSEWNGTGYEMTEDEVSDTASYPTRYIIPDNEITNITGGKMSDYIERYFSEDPTRVERWDGDSDHPDVLNITITVNTPCPVFNRYTGQYVTLSDDTAEMLGKRNIDFGYGTGRGSGAGSGSIYEGLGFDSASKNNVMSGIFKTFFWGLIPVIFVLSIFKLAGKALL